MPKCSAQNPIWNGVLNGTTSALDHGIIKWERLPTSYQPQAHMKCEIQIECNRMKKNWYKFEWWEIEMRPPSLLLSWNLDTDLKFCCVYIFFLSVCRFLKSLQIMELKLTCPICTVSQAAYFNTTTMRLITQLMMLVHELGDLPTDAVSYIIIAISRFTFTSIGTLCIDAISVHLTAIICSTSMYTLINICH